MIDLCKYQDIFGKPKTGTHSIRIFDIAIIDLIITLVAGFMISYIYKINFIDTIFFLFILGIIAHRLFCVRTTIDKIIFT